MLRGENIVAGTSTTGTGTLTFSACPSSIGALDFYQYLATDFGIANGKSVIVPYVIIEYVDSNFAKPSQMEKGIGTVAVGASLTATTLARTTVQVTQTGSTYSDQAPSAISVGTAANTLVFIGASAADIPAFSPYFENTLGDAKGIMVPTDTNPTGAGSILLSTDGTNTDFYGLFTLWKPILVKKGSIYVGTAYNGTTGTPVSTAYLRIYDMGSTGRPSNLLIDLGSLGTNPLNSTGFQSTSVASTGVYLPPGEYFYDLFATFTGATGTVTNPQLKKTGVSISPGNWLGTSGQVAKGGNTIATGGSSSASNPANVTGYAYSGVGASGSICVWLASS